MDLTMVLSLAGSATLGGLALLAVFLPSYNDTLLERIGLSAIALWCFVRVAYRLEGGTVTPSMSVLLVFGLALYVIGFYFDARKRKLYRE